MSERDLCNTIIEYLNYTGKVYCWRTNSGVIRSEYKGKERMIRLAQAGTSDIQGIRKRDGKFIALEVKLPNTVKTLTDNQKNYLLKMKEYGAITGVVTSPEEGLKLL